MTSNQIAYFKVKVEEQHYQNQDVENQRHNKVSEQQTAASIQETVRSNQARESYNNAALLETQTHNRVVEQQGWENLGIQEMNAQANMLTAVANVGLTNAKTVSQELNNTLDQKYAEVERVLGTGSGKGGGGMPSTVAAIIKSNEYLKSVENAKAGTTDRKWTNQSANTNPIKPTASTIGAVKQQVQTSNQPKFNNTVPTSVSGKFKSFVSKISFK